MQGNYYLSRMRNPPLAILGETEYQAEPRFGVRRDWEMLRSILDKALAAIPEERQTALYRDWVWVDYHHGVDYRLVMQVGVAGLIGILVVLFWNRSLKREVDRRARAEAEATRGRVALARSYEKLKAFERQKEDLVHMVVHDMRTPLTILLGSLDLTRTELAKGMLDPEGATGSLEQALNSTREVNRMVDALLDVSRMEAGKMPVEPVMADVEPTLRAGAEVLREVARREGITLEMAGSSFSIPHDRVIVRRVMHNLLANAIKSCRPGDRIDISWTREAAGVRVEVRDTGRGIPEADQERIFDKFTQSGSGGSARGSGVGLAFCRLAVEAHGGTIGVKSRPGEGSTFWFTLPLPDPR
jgi:signal transduction histidine kinase